MDSLTWEKPPAALAESFAAGVARHPEMAIRKMFGMPAAFLAGTMTMCLFGSGWALRLAPSDREALLAAGGAPFEPVAGRSMKDYVLLPTTMVTDPDARDAWVERAIAFVRSLPAKG